MIRPSILPLLGFCWLVSTVSAGQVHDTTVFRAPESSFAVYRGKIDLPAEGVWQFRSTTDRPGLQLYAIPPAEARQIQVGKRMGMALRDRRVNASRWKVRSLYDPSREYALENEGVGAAAIDDFDQEKYGYLIAQQATSPWRRDVILGELDNVEGPFAFLIPNVQFRFSDGGSKGRVPLAGREVLAVELRPYVDDGMHWVCYTDGSCARTKIDEALVKKHSLKIKPVIVAASESPQGKALPYTLVAVLPSESKEPIEVVMFNSVRGDEQGVNWNLDNATDDPSVEKSLETARQLAWRPYVLTGPAPALKSWGADTGPSRTNRNRRRRGRSGDDLTMFSLLGGRAAVEETLQLQNLNVLASSEVGSVDVSTIQGVKVKSHPYEEMLAGHPGGELELANVVPNDRFMVYVAKPDAILPMLDHGAGFLASAGAAFTQNQLDYDLTNRYMDRLGVSREWLDAVLRSGLVSEVAVILPDLFLIDGTDLTVVSRLRQPAILNGLLRLVGVSNLGDTDVLTRKSEDGRDSYWALRGDLLFMSTNRAELTAVLDLADQDGQGSLGRSAEFRYMLTQLPLRDETRIYAYFSDPFVRRLVGPDVKLAQMRRIRARAAMEAATFQKMFARLNGQQIKSIAELKRLDYLPENFPEDEYSFDELGFVHSKSYGPLPGMKTLPEVPVDQVTPAEAEAYRLYVANYSRFWRQFFDPIAIRLDDTAEGELQLSTFILPLVDSSIYNQLRTFLMTSEDDKPLSIPSLKPTPVLQFSTNLRDEAWQQVARNFAGLFRRFGGASPALLDDLGPGAHLAVFDADPVIALGSGDVMGAFGGNILRGGDEMLMLPVALSMLTRPCTILIETRDAEQTARYLRQAATAWANFLDANDDDFRVSFYQVDDRDSWVWSMEIVGLIKLRFGVEVTDQYLVIRNIPWSSQDQVVQVADADLNGAAMTLSPAACRLQLPGLFASAADQERKAALSGMGRLYPIVLSGLADVDSAADYHQRLFGFRPVHPSGGSWDWNNLKLTSTKYGAADRQRQPAFDPKRPFGLMQSVEVVDLQMQFEDAGLRSQITWKFDDNQQ